jgi:ABC-type branched-subunit amino acid transport system substrate-binding protein
MIRDGATVQVFEVPQVCYGATNPALGNKAVYPYFLRTIPSDSLQGMALASVASILNYTRIAILANTDAYGSGVAGTFPSWWST